MSDSTWEILKLLLTLLGGGGGAWIGNMIRDRIKSRAASKRDAEERPAREDRAAIEITEQLNALASGAVAEVTKRIERVQAELDAEREKTAGMGRELATVRQQATRLTGRVTQLENTLSQAGLPIPPEIH